MVQSRFRQSGSEMTKSWSSQSPGAIELSFGFLQAEAKRSGAARGSVAFQVAERLDHAVPVSPCGIVSVSDVLQSEASELPASRTPE